MKCCNLNGRVPHGAMVSWCLLGTKFRSKDKSQSLQRYYTIFGSFFFWSILLSRLSIISILFATITRYIVCAHNNNNIIIIIWAEQNKVNLSDKSHSMVTCHCVFIRFYMLCILQENFLAWPMQKNSMHQQWTPKLARNEGIFKHYKYFMDTNRKKMII